MFEDIIKEQNDSIEVGILIENLIDECEPLIYQLHELHGGEVGVSVILGIINEQIKMRVDIRIKNKFGDKVITDGKG